jgi:hypothetical protein
MKVFNKITTVTFAATMMVAQVQAIELVKVEPVATFTITEAAQESLSESMKVNISNITSANVVFDIQKSSVNALNKNKTENFAKATLNAE